MEIKDILQQLSPSETARLRYALEEELTNQYVQYIPGRFIGVNMIESQRFKIEQTAGYYAEGQLLQGQMNGHA